jgi:uncharacterized protein
MIYWVYIIIIAVVIIGITILPYIAPKLLFIPDKTTPANLLSNEFITPEGISAIFYDLGPNTPIIIYSHGNAGNIFNRTSLANYNLASLLLYDYRGFGRSIGETTTSSILEDGEHIYNYVKNTYPDREIILWGESMGSAVTWYLASKYNVSKVIITSGFASLANVISNVIVSGLGTLLSYLMFLPDNTVHVDKVQCPVLLLHAGDDSLIPISEAENLKEINPGNITLVRTYGGHNFNIASKLSVITDFILSRNMNEYIVQNIS